MGYAPNGTLDRIVFGHPTFSGNTLTENTTLNTLWQITNRNLQVGSAFPVQLGFTYGAAGKNNGNLTQETILTTAVPNPPPGVSIPALNLTQTYAYDAYDRLSTGTETGGTSDWSQTYLYDQYGNRAVQTGSYIPNPNGTPTATSQFSNNRWTSAAFDATGDETTIPGSTSETFTYDAEYRVAAANANGTITYSYDAEGRRVQKTASTFQTTFVYDAAGKEIMESTIPGTGFPNETPFSGTEYLVGDHLGSTRLAIDSQGNVVRRYDFLPFGEELKAGVGGRGADYEPSTYLYPNTPDDVTREFTGKERDSESGLDYFNARYMSSAQGRFTSPDPDNLGSIKSDPQSWNMYGYVRNNPLRFTDELGLNYSVCDTNGKNCADLTDGQYNDYLKSSSSIYETAGDSLYSVNQDGSDTKVGSATYYNEKDVAGAAQIGAQQLLINEFVKQAVLNAGFNLGARGLFAGLSYGLRLYRASQAGEAAIAATPVGPLGASFSAAGNNGEQLIGGRLYSGHALNRLQERGAVPSVVEDITSSGTRSPGRYPGTTEVKGANGTVILGGKLFGVAGAEKVITVIPK